MDRSTQIELESIKAELQNIIGELQSISYGVNRDFDGIGNERCAAAIQSAADYYIDVKNELNRIDTTIVTEEFKTRKAAEKAAAERDAREAAAREAAAREDSEKEKVSRKENQGSQPAKVPLNQRTWRLVDDGGINWGWGIDGDAKYKDQYGKVYTGKELYNALVKAGMEKDKAEKYVLTLQKKLGA